LAPFIPVPGVAQFKIQGTVSGHTFVNNWFYSQSSPQTVWTTAQLNTVCDNILSSIAASNGIGPLTAPEVTWSAITAVDLSSSTPATGANSHAAVSGTGPAGAIPPSICVLVNNVIGDRYRGGHPRSYMPPMAATSLISTDDQWAAASVNSYQTAYQNMQDNVFAAVTGTFQCIPRYNYTYTDNTTKRKWTHQRTSLNHVAQVRTWLVRTHIAHQTRRASIGG
jgi:hypothetical protein